MKNSFIILTLFFTFSAKAQLTLTQANNAPIAGYSFSENYYDSVTTIPKATGLNKSWNFTGMNLNASYSAQTFSNATSSPSASSFPSANISIASGTNSYSFYNSQTGSLDYLGDVNLATGNKINYNNTIVWMKWPFAFGNTNSDTFSGSVTTTATPYSVSGNMNITAAGTGTVTLPSGMIFTNCLQVVRTFTFTYSFPTLFYVQQGTYYEYWSASYRNPIAEALYSTFSQGSITTKSANFRTNAAADVGIEENKLDEQKLLVFPNPVKDKLNIILPDNAVAEEIELFDVNGNLVIFERSTNAINTTVLNKGIYTVIVKHNNLRYKKQIILAE